MDGTGPRIPYNVSVFIVGIFGCKMARLHCRDFRLQDGASSLSGFSVARWRVFIVGIFGCKMAPLLVLNHPSREFLFFTLWPFQVKSQILTGLSLTMLWPIWIVWGSSCLHLDLQGIRFPGIRTNSCPAPFLCLLVTNSSVGSAFRSAHNSTAMAAPPLPMLFLYWFCGLWQPVKKSYCQPGWHWPVTCNRNHC